MPRTLYLGRERSLLLCRYGSGIAGPTDRLFHMIQAPRSASGSGSLLNAERHKPMVTVLVCKNTYAMFPALTKSASPSVFSYLEIL